MCKNSAIHFYQVLSIFVLKIEDSVEFKLRPIWSLVRKIPTKEVANLKQVSKGLDVLVVQISSFYFS